MKLGDLIAYLGKKNPSDVATPGFGSGRSYRGSYDELAFAPVESSTAADMLAEAKKCVGATFAGYKGGDFTMDEFTPVNIASYGECDGDDEITSWRLDVMFNATQPDPRDAEIARLREAAGELRLCVSCGKTVDAKIYKPGDTVGGCGSEPACVLDMTPQEAWVHWRDVAHERYAAGVKQAAEIERLREALTEIRDQHIGDCPQALAHLSDLEWAQRCHGHLRSNARAALGDPA